MKKELIYNKNLNGEITVPGDKSISHRAIIFGALAEGVSKVKGVLKGEDCIATMNCFRELGIKIEEEGDDIYVYGNGLYGLKKPNKELFAGNSGTTMKLLSAILSVQDFSTVITGDSSLSKRPMKNLITPLSMMGADISSTNDFCPLYINGSKLKGIEYTMPSPTAQVKSAILLASLYADGDTTIIEKIKSRNHTEIMFRQFGLDIHIKDGVIHTSKVDKIIPAEIEVCGDISSASFIIAGAVITENSHVIIRNVGVNPTRMGFVQALIKMGANIKLLNARVVNSEKVADIEVKSSKLNGIEISGEIIPLMIDEVPLFALVASLADGTSVVRDAVDLRGKETDRIKAIVTELNKLGADIKETKDGMIIQGNKTFVATECESYNDHRIAMCLVIASLVCKEPIMVDNIDCINVSFPNFFEILDKL